MRGTITIKAEEPHHLSMNMNVQGVTRMDQVILVDALCEAFELNKEDRVFLGMLISIGGLKTLDSVDVGMARIPKEVIDLLKKEKEK